MTKKDLTNNLTFESTPACRPFIHEIERLIDDPARRVSAALAGHLDTCDACRDRLARTATVTNLLNRAKWSTLPADTLARCNRQAISRLQKRTREMQLARELAHAQPDLPHWQIIAIHLSRAGASAAAGLAIVILNSLVQSGLTSLQSDFQKLSDVHQHRHIVLDDDTHTPQA